MKNNNLIAISGKINSGKDTVGLIIKYLIDCKINFNLEGITESDFIGYVDALLFTGFQEDLIISKDNYEIKKYANKLKDIVCILINCTREQLEDRVFKEQELGKEWWYIKKWYPANPEHKKIFTLIPYIDFDSRIFDGDDSCAWEVIKTTPRLLLQLLGTNCGRDTIHPNIWVNALFSEYNNGRRVKLHNATTDINTFDKWVITDMRFPNEMEAVKQRNGITIRVERGLIERTGKVIQESEHESETALDNAKFDYVLENNGTLKELIEKVREILIEEKII